MFAEVLRKKENVSLAQNICVLSLMGLLDIHFKCPAFLTEIDFDRLKSQISTTQAPHLFGFDHSRLLNLTKSTLRMAYIEQQTAHLVSAIEIFVSSHFGKGKILNPSRTSQETIIKLCQSLNSGNLHTSLDSIHDLIIGTRCCNPRTQKQPPKRHPQQRVSDCEDQRGHQHHGGENTVPSAQTDRHFLVSAEPGQGSGLGGHPNGSDRDCQDPQKVPNQRAGAADHRSLGATSAALPLDGLCQRHFHLQFGVCEREEAPEHQNRREPVEELHAQEARVVQSVPFLPDPCRRLALVRQALLDAAVLPEEPVAHPGNAGFSQGDPGDSGLPEE